MATVVVVGGGITGLTSAYLLQKEGHEVVLLEAGPRTGGKIRSERFHGVNIEAGADAFLPRDTGPLDIAREVGLGDQLIEPAVFGAYIYSDGALRRLPPGSSYGLPRSPVAAFKAGLLSPLGTARALSERVLGRRLRGPDVSIGEFVRSRFGVEVLERLVDPLLAGTRAGHPEQISLAAGAREIDALARTNGSVSRALRASSDEIGAGSVRFVSIAGGLQRLCEALQGKLDDVHLDSPVDALERVGSRYLVSASGSAFEADRVVITAPAFTAARLVRSFNDVAAEDLDSIRYVSSALVALAYPEGAFDPPVDGSGVLIPSREGLFVTGITWYSSKWPAAKPTDGSLIFRCFVGRTSADEEIGWADDELIARVVADVGSILSIDVEPIDGAVFHWDRAMPIYEVGHLERVARIRAALPPAIALAGAAFDGTGIPDCMRSAAGAATLVSGT
jgi:oxygen-dependent protoporphyrinogen oxidase